MPLELRNDDDYTTVTTLNSPRAVKILCTCDRSLNTSGKAQCQKGNCVKRMRQGVSSDEDGDEWTPSQETRYCWPASAVVMKFNFRRPCGSPLTADCETSKCNARLFPTAIVYIFLVAAASCHWVIDVISNRLHCLSVYRYPDGTVKLRNPNIELMDQDILYHLALGSGSHDLVEMFGDVKVIKIHNSIYW